VIAILGSGFGLYGYLPALVDGCGQCVVLPERYRARFCERPELARFGEDVKWERDEAMTLDCAEGAVLALRPIDQSEWIRRCLARPNIERLLLEKPLATSPKVAAALFGDLTRASKVIRIAYTFRYTAWGKRIRDALRATGESRPLSIQWEFLSHHFRHGVRNWKRFNVSGGGAIRFYGIQLIALLAEIGYRDVTLSRSFGKSVDEVDKWTASFAGMGLPECDIAVDTRATVDKFRVELLSNSSTKPGAVLANLIDPFDPTAETAPKEGLDRRVPILSRLCRSLWEQSMNEHVWYEAMIELWRRIEEETRFART
jgi:predicted dehydrogenase